MGVAALIVIGLVYVSEQGISWTYVVSAFTSLFFFLGWFLLLRGYSRVYWSSVRHRRLKLVVLLCLLAALYTQFFLGLATTPLALLWPLIAPFLSSVFLAGAAVCGLWLAIAVCWKKDKGIPMFLGGLCLFFVVAPPLASLGAFFFQKHQEAINDREGEKIGLALIQYQMDHGAYPQTLSALKPRYIKSIPWWWHGFIRRPYLYWTEYRLDDEVAYLKFCSELGGGRFFDLKTRQWRTEVL